MSIDNEINNKRNFFNHDWCREKRLSFDFFYAKDGLNVDNFPPEFFSVVNIFQLDCNFNLTDCYSSMQRLFIVGYFNDERCELMLRYGGYGNELVVARIEFINKRQGKMTGLYQILKLIQDKYETGKIIIESVQTEEMRNWCIKNGFVEDPMREKCYIDSKI